MKRYESRHDHDHDQNRPRIFRYICERVLYLPKF